LAVWSPFVALILISFALGLGLTRIVRDLSKRRGLLDSTGAEGHHKAGLRQVPNTGGIAIMLAVALPAAGAIAMAYWANPGWIEERSPTVAANLSGMRSRLPMALGLLLALTGMHLVGVLDDRKALGPGIKFVAQSFIAGLLVYLSDSRLLTLMDSWPGLVGMAPWPSVIVTVVWMVAVTNAINFMDNMDGLAGGVAGISTGLFLIAAYLNGQWFIAAMLALLLGALLAFMCFNFPPATIFMGDGGSLVVGFLLGFLTVRTTYFGDTQETRWYGIFMPIIVLAIPLYDLVAVTVIRIRQGRSPFVGDQQHFSHRLVQSGLSKEAAVLVICGCSMATGISGISLGQVQGWQALLIGVQTVLILAALATFERFFLRRRGNGGPGS